MVVELMKVLQIILVIIFGFIGQIGCWGLMIGGQAITTLENALIIHAVGAPIVFAIVSFIYFKKLNYTKPLITGIIFVVVVLLMDFFIVSLLINKNFDMFLSPIGTWIPFALIFTATYLTGTFVRK
jgi:hypothetical protein